MILSTVTLTFLGLSSDLRRRPCPLRGYAQGLRTAEASAKLDPSAKAQYEELKAKGVERCNADDDKRADAFFADAMKLLGK